MVCGVCVRGVGVGGGGAEILGSKLRMGRHARFEGIWTPRGEHPCCALIVEEVDVGER